MSGETVTVYVVHAVGDPVPITVALTGDLAERYATALAHLPKGHPLRTFDAQITPCPLISELPSVLREPELAPLPY